MAEADDGALQLIEALEKRGVERDSAAEAAASIQRNKVAVIYWNEADRERVVLHAFELARARSLLDRALGGSPDSDGRETISRYIRGIDEHVRLNHWPTEIAEDDPVLLAAMWRRQQLRLSAAEAAAEEAGRKRLVAQLESESNRLLRALLKRPAAASPGGIVESVDDRELAAGLMAATDRHARAVMEEALHARLPAAYGFLSAVFGTRRIAKLNRLIDLRRIDSSGFSRSLVQTPDRLSNLTENLAVVRDALGLERFARITAGWDTLDKLRLVAVLDLHPPAIKLGGYHLAYPVEYSDAQMPPWMESSSAGELRSEASSDAGAYVLLADVGRAGTFDEAARQRLHGHYLDFQNDLIKPNYDALQLIVAHSDVMTKLTAQTIVSLLGQMVDAYRKIASRTDGDVAIGRYEALLQGLDKAWDDLSQNDELPTDLRHRITSIGGASPTDCDSVHCLIRYLHEKGNRALERLMTAARADMSVTVGRIGGDATEIFQIAGLDEAPIIVNGVIRHRAVSAIVRAARWLPTPVPGTFVLVRNHISYSVRLGEHRAELSANIEAPDKEGFIRLQSFQGGIELAQQLRGAFIRKVLTEAGLTVTCDQEGLVDTLVVGILNKDHGARTDVQIEEALIVVLRLLWSLRDLDFAMAYLYAQETYTSAREDRTLADRINEFAASLARIFLVEGRIPFAYRGEGMPFDTYCQYTGPSMHREYRAYLSEERRMVRYRLFFTLNALLQKFSLPSIPAGMGGIGQEIVDKYFNRPLRDAVGRGELKIDARGQLERNLDHQPLKEITRAVVAREDDALRVAVLLKRTDLSPAFRVIGSIDQLTVLGAQQELAPAEWLVIYGLADDENRTVLYAFGQYSTCREEGRWLSLGELRRCLRKAGYCVPDKIEIPAFRKLVSHRLLVERPRARGTIMGSSVRGLLASVGDGSVRIGRVTFDRSYFAKPQIHGGRVLLVPYTTPEDIEAIRAAEAVLVTSGGLLSHAGVTTREFAIPSLILPHAEWIQSPQGATVRLEERHPAKTHETEEGFWVSDSMVLETVTVREGDVVLVWPSQGIVSVLPMSARLLEEAHELILGIVTGAKSAANVERWLAELASTAAAHGDAEPVLADALAFILAEALWDKRLDSAARRELIDVVHQARAGMRPETAQIRLPEKSAAYVDTMVHTVSENAFTELEQLLSEVEHSISAVNVYWRAVNIVAVVERLWVQLTALADSLALFDDRIKVFERRIERLRRHPRIALLRTSALHEVESFSRRSLSEGELPAIRKALRRLGHSTSGFRPQKVLLVCTANIDRSPMAEFLLNKMLRDEGIGGIEVFSRGVAASEDRPMSEISQALLLSEDGIAGAAHRSRRLAEVDVRSADLILAMEHAHVKQLISSYPEANDRIFLLSSYGRVREIGDIEDPAGQVGDAYPRMKRALQIALAGALRHMREKGFLAKAMTAHLQARADELTSAKRRRIAESELTVLPLEEVDADSVQLVGGKGANLGEIAQIVRRHGAHVPPALMVTTFAFERFLDENGIREKLARMTTEIDALHLEHGLSDEDLREHIVEASEAIRDLIFRGNLDVNAGVGREIMQAVDTYGLRSACLSVRSSGLQEDTEEAAFAGAAETYLCVSPVELLDWIKTVWRSFWLTRGILYRSSRIVRQGPVKPAVVIQQMFESQVSGVMFTTDPVSGRDVIVVEAGYGLGEGVVSGLVDVDRYYVDKFDGSVTGIHVGKKSFMVRQHPSGKGTSIVPVDNDLRDAPCLKERDIRANIALALEEHYALSQDIEFAIADGKFCVLQTRPITTR